MAFPSLTKQWHSQPYQAIDPLRPELSQKGKVVAITGAGGSIGTAIALAFAKAGAKIAVIGRRDGPLQDTKSQGAKVVPGSNIEVVHGDISDRDSIKRALNSAKQALGEIDILVCNAGVLPDPQPLKDADPEAWWTGFEINTKGAFNCTRAFLSVCAQNAIVVDISAGLVHLPALASASAYVASKLAATKIYETFGAENTHVEVVHIHPGVVESGMSARSGVAAKDSADLPASFAVWACSEEGKFLRGRGKYLWCNWDVEEMKSREEELSKAHALTITLNGWPFG